MDNVTTVTGFETINVFIRLYTILQDGRTVLMNACLRGLTAIVRTLVNSGADVNIADEVCVCTVRYDHYHKCCVI